MAIQTKEVHIGRIILGIFCQHKLGNGQLTLPCHLPLFIFARQKTQLNVILFFTFEYVAKKIKQNLEDIFK